MDKNKLIVDSLFLFNASPNHRNYSLVDFNHTLIFPLLHNKLRVFYDQTKPVSLVTWCWLSDEQSEQFLSDGLNLTEEDYSKDSGDKLWGIEFIAPYGHARKTLKNMRQICHTLYGEKTAVHWIRLNEPEKLHKRIF
jgi:cytolysin-activating lysine-acyltransferase